jgi:hypothetical protein
MRNSGYVEDNEFKDKVNQMVLDKELVGYFCAGCEYMKTKFNSPTGYWCIERQFPDLPFGCCDYYRKKEE